MLSFPPLWKKRQCTALPMAVTSRLYQPLEKWGGATMGTALGVTVHRHCHGGEHRASWCHPLLCCSRLRPGGHRRRGGGAIGQGVMVPPRHLHKLTKLQTFSRFDSRQLELLLASDANSQSVFSKHVRAKLAFLKTFSINIFACSPMCTRPKCNA